MVTGRQVEQNIRWVFFVLLKKSVKALAGTIKTKTFLVVGEITGENPGADSARNAELRSFRAFSILRSLLPRRERMSQGERFLDL